MPFRFAASAAPRFAAVSFLAASLASPAPAAPLTLTEAQRIAVERSTQLVARQASAASAREMAVAAAQLPDPVLKLQVNNLPVDGSDAFSLTRDFMTMRSVGVMQEITRAEKREANAARFEREADRSAAERLADLATIRRDSALAWLDRYYAEAMQTVLDEQRHIAQTEIDAVDSAYRGGRGSLADVLGARTAVATLDDRASDARRRVGTAKIALARFVGDEAQAPLAGQPAIDELPLDARSVDAEILHHPQIAVLDRREAVAAAEVKAAQAARKPDWSVEVMYSLRGPAYSNMVSVGVSVPLPWDRAHRQDREVAARLATLDEVRAEREDMRRAHAAEVRAMLEEWRVGRERSLRYARELVPLAAERTEATLAAYRGAKASMADVLAARRSEIDVRTQALQLEWDAARAWAQLNFLDVNDDALREPGRAARNAQ